MIPRDGHLIHNEKRLIVAGLLINAEQQAAEDRSITARLSQGRPPEVTSGHHEGSIVMQSLDVGR